jgi:hypothetical protein
MEKRIAITSLFIVFAMNNFGQIAIDSLNIFSTNSTVVDSVFVGGMSSGQQLEEITLVPMNDACGTVNITLVFRGCLPIQTTFFDTVVHIGFPTQRINVSSKWDTLPTCPYPLEPMYTDTVGWDICSVLGLPQERNEQGIVIYPNPSTEIVHIEKSENIKILDVEIFDAFGKKITATRKKEDELCVSTIPKGTYYLKITTNKGLVTKKMIKE